GWTIGLASSSTGADGTGVASCMLPVAAGAGSDTGALAPRVLANSSANLSLPLSTGSAGLAVAIGGNGSIRAGPEAVAAAVSIAVSSVTLCGGPGIMLGAVAGGAASSVGRRASVTAALTTLVSGAASSPGRLATGTLMPAREIVVFWMVWSGAAASLVPHG